MEREGEICVSLSTEGEAAHTSPHTASPDSQPLPVVASLIK